jgi:ferredoxin
MSPFMAKIVFNQEEEVELPEGSLIKETCEELGVPFACEEGVCGTCVIEIEEGMENLSPFTQEEEDFLGEMGTERLACQCKIRSGCVKIKF